MQGESPNLSKYIICGSKYRRKERGRLMQWNNMFYSFVGPPSDS